MMFVSRHWLAGSALALAVVIGSAFALSLKAQTPGSGSPSARDEVDAGSLPSPISTPALPAARAGTSGMQKQGDLLKLSRNVAGDAKPIVLEAEEVHTWTEGDYVVLLLTGQVLAQQSVVQGRCQQAVVWIDRKRHQSTGIWHLDLYAEGQVRLDNSVEAKDAPRAVLDLNTRGEFRFRGSRGKVHQQNRSGEAIVGRARSLGLGVVKEPAPPAVTPVSAKAPAVVPPPPGATPGGLLPPAPFLPQAPAEEKSKSTIQPAGGIRPMSYQKPGDRPASSDVVLAQATVPAPGGGPPPSPSSGPPESVPPPPGQVLPSQVPVPPPPVPDTPRDAGPNPEPEGGARPPIILPNPTPVPEAPLPPPSTPTVPPRPGELPKTSTPEKPLEHRLLPRTGDAVNTNIENLPSGRRIIIVTGGLILNVRNVPKIGIIDVEADRAVIWVKDRDDSEKIAQNIRNQNQLSDELEFYLAGHVVLRSQVSPRERSVLEADELYYDAKRNVAVALKARLELKTERFAASRSARIDDPIVLAAPEIYRTGPNTFELNKGEIFSSKLPSDPGLKLLLDHATLTNRERPRTFFGYPVYDKTGKPVMIEESIVEAKHVFAELEGVPFYYTPYLVTDARDPLGPLETISFGGNRVYGFQSGVGLNVYKLFGLLPLEGTRWRVMADYMGRRGPAMGTNFDYKGVFDSLIDLDDPYGVKPTYVGAVRAYGIYDEATDILGGARPANTLTFDPPGGRGRVLWRQDVHDLPYGIDVISQMSLLSDRNFLEQYFKREFDQLPNQANFLYAKMQQDNWAVTGLVQGRTSDWITTTEWLPRADAYLLGQDLWGLFTSNTQVSLGYARLRVSSDPPQPLQGAPNPPGYPQSADPTTQNSTTARLGIMQELGLPLDLGAVKLVPYVKGALIEYTEDLQGNEVGRAWGGFGARASMPLTRLYPEVASELFNLRGINHKVVLSGNYLYARSNEPYTRFPELDRLNDDATEEMLRDFRPQEPLYNARYGVALATSPYFDPQTYAIRRLIDNRLDTLADIQVLQVDLRQRLQTKRGYPGFEHIVDWMVLDTSLSYFPEPTRDNFGKPFSFLEYQYVWNLGDRTTIESTGWYDPQDNGARVWTVGSYFNRPDRTTYYIGYRQIDPVESRIVTGSLTYVFSPKYAMTLAASYDFGTQQAQTNTLILTRTGTDLQVSLGFMYNSIQNNFGAIVEVVPNLVPVQRRGGGTALTGFTSR